VLLVKGRGEMAILAAVTAILLHHSAICKGTYFSVFGTRLTGIIGCACGYCSTDTSQFYL